MEELFLSPILDGDLKRADESPLEDSSSQKRWRKEQAHDASDASGRDAAERHLPPASPHQVSKTIPVETLVVPSPPSAVRELSSRGLEVSTLEPAESRGSSCATTAEIPSQPPREEQRDLQPTPTLPKGVSKFKGVSWNKSKKKWKAQITIKGKNTYLGMFDSEEDAARKYDEAANQIGKPVNFVQKQWQFQARRNLSRPCGSKYKGVSWHPKEERWKSVIKFDSKPVFLGFFGTEEAAAAKYDQVAAKYFRPLNFEPGSKEAAAAVAAMTDTDRVVPPPDHVPPPPTSSSLPHARRPFLLGTAGAEPIHVQLSKQLNVAQRLGQLRDAAAAAAASTAAPAPLVAPALPQHQQQHQQQQHQQQQNQQQQQHQLQGTQPRPHPSELQQGPTSSLNEGRAWLRPSPMKVPAPPPIQTGSGLTPRTAPPFPTNYTGAAPSPSRTAGGCVHAPPVVPPVPGNLMTKVPSLEAPELREGRGEQQPQQKKPHEQEPEDEFNDSCGLSLLSAPILFSSSSFSSSPPPPSPSFSCWPHSPSHRGSSSSPPLLSPATTTALLGSHEHDMSRDDLVFPL